MSAKSWLAALLLVSPGMAQATPDMSALIGRWQIDLSRTHMGRYGPDAKNMVRAPSFTFIFARHGPGVDVNVNVYEHYPQAAPTRIMSMIPDGKPHACQDKAACLTVGGDAADQSYVYRQLSPRFFMRLFYVKGKLSEYSTYGVSTDGQTFTMMAWSPETPFWQNIQTFTRQP